jgi:hypothetical protein
MTPPRRGSKRASGERRRFQALGDSDLLDMLHSAGDRLPREAVDEILRRGPRMIPLLNAVVTDKAAWTQPLPDWWAVVHATYVLGAMERPETLLSLLAALRWADAFDCDWVTEDLPSIFGRMGAPAYPSLRSVLEDATAGWGARAIALASMAAVALTAEYLRDDVIQRSVRTLADPEEDLYLRQTAANVLLDFQVRNQRDLLIRFGEEEAARKAEDPEYRGVFYDWEVDEYLDGADPTRSTREYYSRDWLTFYDPDEIERRQDQWRREQEESADEPDRPQHPPARDLQRPCHCGSGQPFDRCCYLKVH